MASTLSKSERALCDYVRGSPQSKTAQRSERALAARRDVWAWHRYEERMPMPSATKLAALDRLLYVLGRADTGKLPKGWPASAAAEYDALQSKTIRSKPGDSASPSASGTPIGDTGSQGAETTRVL